MHWDDLLNECEQGFSLEDDMVFYINQSILSQCDPLSACSAQRVFLFTVQVRTVPAVIRLYYGSLTV